jgi:hypothetical protein
MDRRTVALIAVLGLPTLAAAQGYEPPPTVKASAALEPALLKGAHHQVAEPVDATTYYLGFKITSDYGEMEAMGRSLLLTRLQEVQALAELEDVSKSDVFLSAAGNSVINVGKGVAGVVTKPGETVKGVGAGVKRFGTNLGRKGKRGAESAADAVSGDEKPASGAPPTEPAKSTTEKAEDAATSALAGKSFRRWAQKLGVDPYTSNAVLRTALTDIAKIDAAGGIAAKVVVPIPMVVSTTATVNNLVWGKDPEELLKINEQRLTELGVSKEVQSRFFKNKRFSPSAETRLIAALHAVKAKGCDDYVDAASEAQQEREALFFVESAEMLQAFHAQNPVTEILRDSRALVAKSAAGATVLVAVDQVFWSEAFAKAAAEVDGRARKELGASAVSLRIPGKVSARARKELEAMKWKVEELPPPAPAAKAKSS